MTDNKKALEQGFKRMFPGGIKSAVEMLQRLPAPERDKILAEIERKDPRVHEFIKKNLVTFNDLALLTPMMVRELMKEIKLDDLGLSLRGSPREVLEVFLNNLSENNKKDLNEILKGKPRPLSDVQKAQEKIMAVVVKKMEKGEIVLSRDSSEKLV